VCGACHGAQGRGGLAPGLIPMTRSAIDLLAIVREGIGQMPPIAPRELSDEDTLRIAEYLRSLGSR
jgi:mono/diheme cytochrome c family protein